MAAGELDANETHNAYNALDSAVTLRVHERLDERLRSQNNPHARTSYSFVRAMQGPALDMMLRGIMVQQKVRQDETARYTAIRDEAQRRLDVLADAVWGPEHYTEKTKRRELHTPLGARGQPLTPRLRTVVESVERQRPRGLNPNSNPQLLAFFNTALRMSVEYEIRKGPEGTTRSPSANDKALRKWAAYKCKGPGVDPRDRTVDPVCLAAPIVSLILTIREMDKNLTVLRTPLDPDGRMRCSYNVVGTENARWCLTGDHEVLTPEGWVRLNEWPGGLIAQWDIDKTLEFKHASPQVFTNTGPMIKVGSRRVSLVATAEHEQPYYTGRGAFLVGRIGERKVLNGVPIGGHLVGDFLPEAQTRASVMMQADGCNIHSNLVRFHFSKTRKIARCIDLLERLGIPFKRTDGQDGTTYIYIYNPPEWLASAKFFGPWCLKHDPAVFCDEVKHWDGSWTGTATEYSTKDEVNAEWLKTMGHLNGQFTSVFKKARHQQNWSDSYRCMLTVDTTTRFSSYSTVSGEEEVYCPLTDTGFFLVRHEGQIVVTGNSSSKNAFGRGTNLQNINSTMRRMFCADDGYRLISTDLEQAESRVVAGLVWAATGDDTYWRACESGDLHTQVCRMAWPELGWTGDAKHDREIANQPYPALPHYSYRDIAKRIGHGSNYRGSAFGIAQAVGIPVQIVTDFQLRYFLVFPSIPAWHELVARSLREDQYLDTPLQRRRYFFGRLDEDKTLREAIAYGPQSTVGELLNYIMWRVWARSLPLPARSSLCAPGRLSDEIHEILLAPHLPIQLLLQNHDAFLLQTPETTDLPNLIEQLNSEFMNAKVPFTRNGEVRHMAIPGEFVTGWNWAYKDKGSDQAHWEFADGNPDGLAKWTGADTRRRQQGARVSPGDWLR